MPLCWGHRSPAPGETRGPQQANPHPGGLIGPQETPAGTPSGCTRRGGATESRGFTPGWAPAALQAAEDPLFVCATHR